MSSQFSHLSGSDLCKQYFVNEQNIKVLHNDLTIAKLQAEIDDLRRRLNNNPEHGGKKRSNRRKHVKHNKKTRKGSRMHKKMH